MEVHQCECAICQAGQDAEVMAYHRQINLMLSRLEEAERRWYMASLSSAPGAPSDVVLGQISGLSDKTIARGRHELEEGLKERGAVGFLVALELNFCLNRMKRI